MTKNDVGFDDWFDTVAMLVLDGAGVDFKDTDSVRYDYDAGKDAHDVADEIISEYDF